MHAKVSGTWREVDPKVKIGGTWKQVKRVWIKKAGTWQLNWGFTWTYTFPAGTYDNYSLTSIADYDDSFDVVITIPSNVTFKATTTGNYALRTGSFSGNSLKIINNGNVMRYFIWMYCGTYCINRSSVFRILYSFNNTSRSKFGC